MKNLRGFSLIEVLITLVLSAIGVLGMMALQSQGLKGTNESSKRTTAVMAAADLMEIMQSYRNELYATATPVYANMKKDTDIYSASGTFSPSSTDCATPANTLKSRAGCWIKDLNSKLDGATITLCPSSELTTGKVTCNADGGGGMIAVQIEWPSSDKDICTNNTCSYVLRMEI